MAFMKFSMGKSHTTSSGFYESVYPVKYHRATEANINYVLLPTNGLILYLPFDSASSSATYIDTTYFNSDVVKNGSADYATIDNVPSAYLTRNEYIGVVRNGNGEIKQCTLSYWGRLTGTGECCITNSYSSYDNGSPEFWLGFDSTHLYFGNGSPNYTLIYVDMPIAIGVWHHIAVTWDCDSDEMYVYFDGECVGSCTSTYEAPNINTSNYHLLVNMLYRASGHGTGNSYYSSVRMYNRVLSNMELKKLYTELTPDIPDVPDIPPVDEPEGVTTYVVSDPGTTWLEGEYVEIGNGPNNQPIYALDTYDESQGSPTVAFIWRESSDWMIYSNTMMNNIEQLKTLLSIHEFNTYMDLDTRVHYKNSNERPEVGEWETIYSGKAPAPIVTLKAEGGSEPDEPDNPSPDVPEETSTTYVVKGAGNGYVDGDYTDIGLTYGSNNVYYCNTDIPDVGNVVIILFCYEEVWRLGYCKEYLETVDDVITYINKGYILFEAIDMFGAEFYHSETGIEGTWLTSWGGTSPAPTVTIKSPSTPDTPPEDDEEAEEVPEGVTAYVVSDVGTGWLKGIYIDTGRLFGDDNVYAREVTNEAGVKCLALMWSNGTWKLTTNTSISTISEFKEVGDPGEIIWGDDTTYWYLSNAVSNVITENAWVTYEGAAPAPTVTLYAGSTEGEEVSTIDFARAAYFNGTNKTRITEGIDSLPFDYADRSVSVWVKPAAITTPMRVLQYGEPVQPLSLSLSAPSLMGTLKAYPYVWAPDTWYHIVISYSGDTGEEKVYVNGTILGSYVDNYPIASYAELHLGHYLDEAGEYGFYFTGNITELRIYNRVLTDTEVEALYEMKEISDGQVLYIPLQEGKDDSIPFAVKDFTYGSPA